MPFVAAPNIIQLEFRYTLFGQQCENRVMIDNLAPVDAAAVEATAILGWDWWETTYAARITSQCTLAAVVATDMSASDGPQSTYAPDATTHGTGSGSAMPNEVSVCVSLRTGSRGRSARGRWFVAGIPNNQLSDANHIESSYATSLVSNLQTLVNSIATAGQMLVIVSYFHDGVARVGGPVYYEVTGPAIVDLVVDSQRRRKPGVGA